ncbi:endo alpha-1,4 polygalactosaminidase [Jiulongibacter sediminis]|jgi:cysteinyl-tRNA synthetase|uniref:endo alpha-1,4 polygalactosaminidase n=1 Tax=Jiulongibacter sediminis TaxID=1605367 RepID=UPI0026EB54D5|nr:endo alpha-1,4 polygalactosaminidase [Jiulongibacter sediminis]
MKKLSYILALFILSACEKEPLPEGIDFKEEMRNFVIGISQWAKSKHPNFAVVPQNGIELLTINGEENQPLHERYVNAIDAQAQEDLFFGYRKDNQASPEDEIDYKLTFLDALKATGKQVLVTDYCWSTGNIEQSNQKNAQHNFVSFPAPERELNAIPEGKPQNENSGDINSLAQAKNFLYLINPGSFESPEKMIPDLSKTNYDLLILDLFDQNNVELKKEWIDQLKVKANGGKRFLLCYMSIGEAEDYRYYWQADWSKNPKSWIERENPDWKGNFKVRYWEAEWQNIIYGTADSYLQKIMDVGFDGVYLDIIDAFEYFEK